MAEEASESTRNLLKAVCLAEANDDDDNDDDDDVDAFPVKRRC